MQDSGAPHGSRREDLEATPFGGPHCCREVENGRDALIILRLQSSSNSNSSSSWNRAFSLFSNLRAFTQGAPES
jgi:hypothetical protein